MVLWVPQTFLYSMAWSYSSSLQCRISLAVALFKWGERNTCHTWLPRHSSLLIPELIFKYLYKLIMSNVKADRLLCLTDHICLEVRNYLLSSTTNCTGAQLMPPCFVYILSLLCQGKTCWSKENSSKCPIPFELSSSSPLCKGLSASIILIAHFCIFSSIPKQ